MLRDGNAAFLSGKKSHAYLPRQLRLLLLALLSVSNIYPSKQNLVLTFLTGENFTLHKILHLVHTLPANLYAMQGFLPLPLQLMAVAKWCWPKTSAKCRAYWEKKGLFMIYHHSHLCPCIEDNKCHKGETKWYSRPWHKSGNKLGSSFIIIVNLHPLREWCKLTHVCWRVSWDSHVYRATRELLMLCKLLLCCEWFVCWSPSHPH